MKAMSTLLLIMFVCLTTQVYSQVDQIDLDCDCQESMSLIVLEDGNGILDVPCQLPDTVSFYSENTGLRWRYIFLDCRGTILYHKLAIDGHYLVQGQFMPTDSVVQIVSQSLTGEDDVFGLNNTEHDAFYARKVGIWVYE